MAQLGGVRDRVLRDASIRDGDTVLDVGCGDGLIAFGALEQVGPTGRVIFSDISKPLLEQCQRLAAEAGVLDRCRFVEASATDLAGIDDASVDVVTTRSVLIYVDDKPAAFRELFRVLRPGGRISLFEPLNKTAEDLRRDGFFWGMDVSAVVDLAARLREWYDAAYRERLRPMLDFDGPDLVRMAMDAGFANVRLRSEVTFARRSPEATQAGSWDVFLRAAPNPLMPSSGEVLDQVLTPEERARFEAHLRPQFEAGDVAQFNANAYLQATKE
jgi:ubiquinone/menaquinone biosynthesis C-methylase UbiE